MALSFPLSRSAAAYSAWRLRRGTWMLAVWLFILAALLPTSCSKSDGSETKSSKNGDGATTSTLKMAGGEKREYTVPVRTIDIVRRDVKSYVSTVGSLAPIQSASITAEASGRILFVKDWKPDDPVDKGETIAQLDDREVQTQIDLAEADLKNAILNHKLNEARVAKAQEDLNRTADLVRKELSARRELDESMMNLKSAVAQRDQSENAVKKSELALDQQKKKTEELDLVARISGVLCAREVIEKGAGKSAIAKTRDILELNGRLVSTGALICGVLDLSQMIVRCDVTTKDIARAQVGAEALALIYLGDQSIEAEGLVTEMSTVIDPDTRAFQVDVTLDNPDGRLRPGMFARVDIVSSLRRDAIAVPRGCLQRRNNQDVVFIVNDQDLAEMRAVSLGIENPDEIEVTDGLREGDRLVILGQETLQDGVKVEVINPGEPASSGIAAGQPTPSPASI